MEHAEPSRSGNKCFILSLHRSATRSTVVFLRSLGMTTRHWPAFHDRVDLQRQIVGHESTLEYVAEVVSPVMNESDALADVPTPVLYQQFHRRFPLARFLLLLRGPFDWVHSVRKHIGDRPFSPFERVQYWHYFPAHPLGLNELTDHDLIGMHTQHTADIIAFFRRHSPSSLAVYDVSDPSLGEHIGSFLGHPGAGPFPHVRGAPTGFASVAGGR